ncbi:MAG: hypothetical protein ACXVDZ_03280 [Bacteroidia bacterium]
MKILITACLTIVSLSILGQNKTTNTSSSKTAPQATNSRTSASSSKAQTTAVAAQPAATQLPYDVNDKYMGRKEEFLFMTTLKELPSDFPLYDKQWGVKEYNGVIEAYFMQHIDILKDNVKPKIQYLIDQQKQAK